MAGGTSVGSINLDLGVDHKSLNKDLSSIAPKAASMTKMSFGKLGAIAAAAFSARAVFKFTMDTVKLGSDVAEIQNVVDVTFGQMSQSVDTFAKSTMENFGLTELSAKKYASTMGAMLKSTGVQGEAFRDMSADLTRLTADMASFYNLDSDDMFTKMQSAMSGEIEPMKRLGLNMSVASLEAFALSKGMGKAYSAMSEAEKMTLRYNFLMEKTADQQGDFSRNSHNWAHSIRVLGSQWSNLKATLGQGFINMLQPIVTGLNILIVKLQEAAAVFRAFTEQVFGDKQAARKTADNLGYIGKAAYDIGGNGANAAAGLEATGKAVKKASKDIKGSLASFDDLNILTRPQKSVDDSDLTGGLPDITGSNSAPDIATIDTSGIDKFRNILKDIAKNWGLGNVFDGIMAGFDSFKTVNLDSIKDSLKTVFTDLKGIGTHALNEMQPVFEAAGGAFGTRIKYGIMSSGSLFDAVITGVAQFTTNSKEDIKAWATDVSGNLTDTFGNLDTIFETIGGSWLSSLDNHKQDIADAVEGLITAAADTAMLAGTIITETYATASGVVADFVAANSEDIELFTDNVVEMFTSLGDLIGDIWSEGLDKLKVAWDEFGEDIVGGISGAATDIWGWFLRLWNEMVKPVWDTMIATLKDVWDNGLGDLVSTLLTVVGKLGVLFNTIWQNIIKPLVDLIFDVFGPVITSVFQSVVENIGTAFKGITDVIDGLLKAFGGVIDFLTGVFTGDWSKAWQGLSDITSGIMDGLVALLKLPINGLIGMVNTFTGGLGKLKLPDWVPGVGGKSINIPEIPLLARGGVVDQPTLAMVGEQGKEAVVPLENNTEWMSKMADMIASRMGGNSGGGNGTPEKIEVALNLDGDELVVALVDLINRQARINGGAVV